MGVPLRRESLAVMLGDAVFQLEALGISDWFVPVVFCLKWPYVLGTGSPVGKEGWGSHQCERWGEAGGSRTVMLPLTSQRKSQDLSRSPSGLHNSASPGTV